MGTAHDYLLHSIEPDELRDTDTTTVDLVFALKHLCFNRCGLAVLKIDEGVRNYLLDALQSRQGSNGRLKSSLK